jgi:hypothetical protein
MVNSGASGCPAMPNVYGQSHIIIGSPTSSWALDIRSKSKEIFSSQSIYPRPKSIVQEIFLQDLVFNYPVMNYSDFFVKTE